MNEIVITGVRVVDLRFPTSRESIGSDAVNKDPDYSAAYCILETNAGYQGHGLTFTLGRGTELCVLALEYLARFVKGRTLDSLTVDMARFCRQLTDESQFRWLGPEKGAIHLAGREDQSDSLYVDAPTPELAALARSTLADKLSENKKLFPSVTQLGGTPFFAQNGLLFLSKEEVGGMTKQSLAE